MTKNFRNALFALFAVTAFSGIEAGPRKLRSPLIGTWQLVRYENTDLKGNTVKPYGEHPKGYFVYDDTGHLSVQIMRTPPIAKFAANPLGDTSSDKATDAEIRAAYNSYVAYFGTWRINESGSVVTHVVEGALNPAYTDTDQPRPFKLTGDTLIIEKTLMTGHVYRELHRVK